MQLQLGVPDKHIWRSQAQANTQLSRFTMLYFEVLLVLVLGSASENLGHPENAVSSSGWWFIIASGQPTAWHREVFHILGPANFVINSQRLSNTQ